MDNYINRAFYLPLVQRFFKETQQLYSCGYPYGPFIPYAMPRYQEAPLKVFYLGRDTYYWAPRDRFLESMRNGKPEDYLKANCDVLKADDILNGYNNNSGSFWNFVAKLHLFIRTGHYFEDINALGSREKQLIEEIGYGNLNGIEVRKTLENEGTWQEITSVADYHKLRQSGKVFEKIKNLLEAYHPDFIVIMNWEERDDIFEGLNVHWLKDYYMDSVQAVYEIEGYDTKIIWTAHPRRFGFLGTNPRQMVMRLGPLFDK